MSGLYFCQVTLFKLQYQTLWPKYFDRTSPVRYFVNNHKYCNIMKEKNSIEHYNVDEWPKAARKYFRSYGFHFNKKACDFAVKGLRRENPSTKKLEPIDPWNKDQVDDLLKRFNVVIEDNELYDYVWVANMVRSDYWKSSIVDEQHLALMIKDIVDDKDQRDGFIFNRWISDRLFNGSPIEWEELV